jgi:hypothetical protein
MRWSFQRRLITTVLTAVMVPLASYLPAAWMAAKAPTHHLADPAVALNSED